MIVAQESYDNSSATLIHMKQIGSLDDWLMAPIYRIEILISLIFTSLIIGIILALFNFLIFTFLVDIEIYNFFYFFYYLFLVIIFFSCLGCFVGIIFNSWDSQSTFSSFFVAPINFLSGTFFSINYLPDNLKAILLYNPYYYVVSFFRNSLSTALQWCSTWKIWKFKSTIESCSIQDFSWRCRLHQEKKYKLWWFCEIITKWKICSFIKNWRNYK